MISGLQPNVELKLGLQMSNCQPDLLTFVIRLQLSVSWLHVYEGSFSKKSCFKNFAHPLSKGENVKKKDLTQKIPNF